MAEGATLGGDVGFTAGGDDGGTLGQAPYIAQRRTLSATARERITLSATFES